MAEMGNLKKITDHMVIIIRVVGLMARCFWFLWEFIGFIYFLEYQSRILGGFMWRLQKNPPISNSKILGWSTCCWISLGVISCLDLAQPDFLDVVIPWSVSWTNLWAWPVQWKTLSEPSPEDAGKMGSLARCKAQRCRKNPFPGSLAHANAASTR